MSSISDSEQRTSYKSRKQYPNIASQNSASQKLPTAASIQIKAVPETLHTCRIMSENNTKFLFSAVNVDSNLSPTHVGICYLNTCSRKTDYSFPEFVYAAYSIKNRK